jgi:protoheme IX farnesyltransferase
LITLSSYVFLYTPLKRCTSACTLVGAIPGAMPPVMGFTAATGVISLDSATLFGILFLWQIPHFLAIAILCREDYARAGFKMLPVIDPTLRTTAINIIAFTWLLVPMSLMPTAISMTGRIYFFGAAISSLIFLRLGFTCAKHPTRSNARRLFFASIIYLPVLLGLMLIDRA